MGAKKLWKRMTKLGLVYTFTDEAKKRRDQLSQKRVVFGVFIWTRSGVYRKKERFKFCRYVPPVTGVASSTHRRIQNVCRTNSLVQ